MKPRHLLLAATLAVPLTISAAPTQVLAWHGEVEVEEDCEGWQVVKGSDFYSPQTAVLTSTPAGEGDWSTGDVVTGNTVISWSDSYEVYPDNPWTAEKPDDCDPPEPKKVFVCKYVGTPGVDERLQTGDNPISVSVNSIPDPEGDGVHIGDEFADQHGRSIVIAFDEGQPEPDLSMCPPPDKPTEVTPPAPTPVDKCGTEKDGVIIPPASEAYSFHKLVDGFDGGLLAPGFNAWTGKIKAAPAEGFIFPAGTKSIWEFEFSSAPCKPTEWPAPTQEVICGAEDVIHVPDDTEDVTYVVKGGPGHTIVKAKWKYDGTVLQTWEFTDDGEECPVPFEPEASVKLRCAGDVPTHFEITEFNNNAPEGAEVKLYADGEEVAVGDVVAAGAKFSWGFGDDSWDISADDIEVVCVPPPPTSTTTTTTVAPATTTTTTTVAPAKPTTTAPGPTSTLANTGSGSGGTVRIALIALLVGLMLVVGTTVRKHRGLS